MARARYPFVPQMLWAIRRHHPDIMLANNGFPATTLMCYLASRRFGIPLAIRTTTHVTEGWHRHPFQAEIYRAADLLIANTRFEKEVLVNDLQLDPENIVTIGNALEAAPFLSSDGSTFRTRYGLGQSRVVAFVGRKVIGKGIDTLIDAMKIVWQQIPSARLIMAGQRDRVYSVPIEEKLAELRPEQAAKVIDIDNFSNEEKPQIYAACDVFAMPSDADSFGLVYLEAWASGKPVIACRNTPQETFINHEENGLLVEYGNVEELAETICRLLSDDALRARLGRNGREKTISTFTWDKVGPKLREQYYRIVNGHRR
jgi:glycosyltransferase involved in cell wall biosynthesis